MLLHVIIQEQECEEEYRKPRKRALSVVSISRRGSMFSAGSVGFAHSLRGISTPEESTASFDSDIEDDQDPMSRLSSPSSYTHRHPIMHSSSSAGYGHTGHLRSPAPHPSGAAAHQQQMAQARQYRSSPIRTTAV